MGVIITIDDIHAYTEVDYIINHMNQRYINMIPEKLLDFFSDLSDPDYNVEVNPHRPLEEQNLQRYTLEIIAILHLKYWCQSEERKQELYNIMLTNNGTKLSEHFKYRESIENLFNNNSKNDYKGEEEIDYSTPKKIQKYDAFTKDNDDIKDYTDVVEENNLPVDSEENIGWFTKLKNKIVALFKK